VRDNSLNGCTCHKNERHRLLENDIVVRKIIKLINNNKNNDENESENRYE